MYGKFYIIFNFYIKYPRKKYTKRIISSSGCGFLDSHIIMETEQQFATTTTPLYCLEIKILQSIATQVSIFCLRSFLSRFQKSRKANLFHMASAFPYAGVGGIDKDVKVIFSREKMDIKDNKLCLLFWWLYYM